MKLGVTEHIRKYSTWYGVSYVLLLCVLLWLFQNWPGGFWDWLRHTPDGYESGSTTVRNLGLIVAGLIALPLTLWRIRVADRQAKAAHKQVETSQNQVATSQRSLLNERYQKGAEMLGSDVLSVRLGGIYDLARLAREHPLDYHVQIMRLFCAFVRNPTKRMRDEEDAKHKGSETLRAGKRVSKLRPDVQAIMSLIGERTDLQMTMEQDAGHYNANSSGYSLGEPVEVDKNLLDFSGANLNDATLVYAKLYGANLTDVRLHRADLSFANLRGAILSNSELHDAILHITDFKNCKGLTQGQLDTARGEEDKSPVLTGVLDAKTGKVLTWRGKSLDDEE